jgi:peptidoglycan/LPS O-acetylase OafA/YrhL
MERLSGLDLLRGTAALAVAIPHFLMLTSSSPTAEVVSVLAVEVFFVLSGFVLSPQILQCLQSGRLSDFGVFLTRRWMRTIPPYLFALVLMSLIVGKVDLADFGRYALYAENLVAQHNAKDYFPVAWSLSIEEWFYVIFPAILLIAASILRNRRIRFSALVAICFVCAVTILRLHFGELDEWGANVRRVVIFRVDAIAYGFLLFVLLHTQPGGKRKLVSVPVAGLLFAFTAAIAGGLTWRIDADHSHAAEMLFPFAAAAFGMSAILLLYSAQDLIQRSHPLLTSCCLFLGQVSYSLYLFHLIIATALAPRISAVSLPVQLAIYLGACFVFSTIFYSVFERPILAVRPSYKGPAPAPAPPCIIKRCSRSSYLG